MNEIKKLLTEEEARLAEAANTGHTGNLNEAHVVSRLYVAKQLREAIDDLIVSNEKLAKASGRTAWALNALTLALVIVGAIQAWILLRGGC